MGSFDLPWEPPGSDLLAGSTTFIAKTEHGLARDRLTPGRVWCGKKEGLAPTD